MFRARCVALWFIGPSSNVGEVTNASLMLHPGEGAEGLTMDLKSLEDSE